jgi:hypothetical protein
LTSGSAQNNPESEKNGGKASLICQQLYTSHYKRKQPHQHLVHTGITCTKYQYLLCLIHGEVECLINILAINKYETIN